MQTQFAITEVGGNQYIVRAGNIIEVDLVDQEVGSEIESAVLLLSDEAGQDVTVGTPFVDGKKVKNRVVEHFRGEKIRVFKMKSKKNYSRTFGFRADKTRLEVLSVA